MEGWGKIGVQRASVLYPNSCYNEPCYIEVQVYNDHTVTQIKERHACVTIFMLNILPVKKKNNK